MLVQACAVDSPKTESSRDLHQSDVLVQVHQRHQRTLARTEPGAPVARTGGDQHGDPLHECMWQVECGRLRDQRGPRAT